MASPHILDFILIMPLTPYTIRHTSSPAFLSSLISLQPHWLFLVFWTCLPCSHRRLLPLPGTLFPQISPCLTPSVHSVNCTVHIAQMSSLQRRLLWLLYSKLSLSSFLSPSHFSNGGQDNLSIVRGRKQYMDTDGWSYLGEFCEGRLFTSVYFIFSMKWGHPSADREGEG